MLQRNIAQLCYRKGNLSKYYKLRGDTNVTNWEISDNESNYSQIINITIKIFIINIIYNILKQMYFVHLPLPLQPFPPPYLKHLFRKDS